jgi:hypothetical protein
MTTKAQAVICSDCGGEVPARGTATGMGWNEDCLRCCRAAQAAQVAHTPGPWQDDHTLTHYGRRTIRHNGVVVAIIPATVTGMSAEERHVNARLIAAAPELLAALRDLVRRADTTELRDGSSLDTAQAAAVLARMDGGEA